MFKKPTIRKILALSAIFGEKEVSHLWALRESMATRYATATAPMSQPKRRKLARSHGLRAKATLPNSSRVSRK